MSFFLRSISYSEDPLTGDANSPRGCPAILCQPVSPFPEEGQPLGGGLSLCMISLGGVVCLT